MPADSKLGAEYYENAIRTAWRRVAECFETLMDEGKLRRADPWLAALHFKALNQLDLYERRLLGAQASLDPKEIERTAKSAADAFLKLYGPVDPPAKAGRRS